MTSWQSICGRVHSYYILNLKIYKWKLKTETVCSVEYSTAEVFLHSHSQKQPLEVFSLCRNLFSIKFQTLESLLNGKTWKVGSGTWDPFVGPGTRAPPPGTLHLGPGIQVTICGALLWRNQSIGLFGLAFIWWKPLLWKK